MLSETLSEVEAKRAKIDS